MGGKIILTLDCVSLAVVIDVATACDYRVETEVVMKNGAVRMRRVDEKLVNERSFRNSPRCIRVETQNNECIWNRLNID